MLERVHEHIIAELQQNTRTDTVFILTAIFLNLLTLGINSAVAAGDDQSATEWTVFFIFLSLLVVVNFIVMVGLVKGKQTRIKLINGLLRMYKDQGVEGYYDASLLSNYATRYDLFLFGKKHVASHPLLPASPLSWGYTGPRGRRVALLRRLISPIFDIPARRQRGSKVKLHRS